MNRGKALGIILLVLGAGGLLVAALWVASSYGAGNLTIPALVLGLSIAFVLAAPFVGAGAFLWVRGRREADQQSEAQMARRLLGMVQAQGQVKISDVALELDATRDQVKAWVYDLVDKGLFAGYTDWKAGTLYSREASELRGERCPNCGGEVALVGKGTVKCPFCGAEVFLTE